MRRRLFHFNANKKNIVHRAGLPLGVVVGTETLIKYIWSRTLLVKSKYSFGKRGRDT